MGEASRDETNKLNVVALEELGKWRLPFSTSSDTGPSKLAFTTGLRWSARRFGRSSSCLLVCFVRRNGVETRIRLAIHDTARGLRAALDRSDGTSQYYKLWLDV